MLCVCVRFYQVAICLFSKHFLCLELNLTTNIFSIQLCLLLLRFLKRCILHLLIFCFWHATEIHRFFFFLYSHNFLTHIILEFASLIDYNFLYVDKCWIYSRILGMEMKDQKIWTIGSIQQLLLYNVSQLSSKCVILMSTKAQNFKICL